MDLSVYKVINISNRDIQPRYNGKDEGKLLKPGKGREMAYPIAMITASKIIDAKIIEDNEGKKRLPLDNQELRAELAEKVIIPVGASVEDEDFSTELGDNISKDEFVEEAVDMEEIEGMAYFELVSFANKNDIKFEKKGTDKKQLLEIIKKSM